MILWIPIAFVWCVCSSLAAKVTLKTVSQLSIKQTVLNIVIELDKTKKYVQGNINIDVQDFNVVKSDLMIHMHFLKKTTYYAFIPVPFKVTKWQFNKKDVKIDTSAFKNQILKSVRVYTRKGKDKPKVIEVEVMNMKNGYGGSYFYFVAVNDFEYKKANVSKYRVKEGNNLTHPQILDLVDEALYTSRDFLILNIGNRQLYRTRTKTCTVTVNYNFPAIGYVEYEHDAYPDSFLTEFAKNGLELVKYDKIPESVPSANVYWSFGSPILFVIKQQNETLCYGKSGENWVRINLGRFSNEEYAKVVTKSLDTVNANHNNFAIDIGKEPSKPGTAKYKLENREFNMNRIAGSSNKDPPQNFHKVVHNLPGKKFNLTRLVKDGKELKLCSQYNGFRDLDRVEVYYSELKTQNIPILVCMQPAANGSVRRCLSLVGDGIWADYHEIGGQNFKAELEDISRNVNKKLSIDISKKINYGEGSSTMVVDTVDSNQFTVYVHEPKIPSMVSKIVKNGHTLSGLPDINDYVVRAKVYYYHDLPRFILLHTSSGLLFCSGANLDRWVVDYKITNFLHANVAAVERDNASYFDPSTLKTFRSTGLERSVSGSENHNSPGSPKLGESAEDYLNKSQHKEDEEEKAQDPSLGHRPVDAPASGYNNTVVNNPVRATEPHTNPKPDKPLQQSTTSVVPKSHHPQPSSPGNAHSQDPLKYAKPRISHRETLPSRTLAPSLPPPRKEDLEVEEEEESVDDETEVTTEEGEDEEEEGEEADEAEDSEEEETDETQEETEPEKKEVEEDIGFAGFSIFDLFSFSGGFAHGIQGLLLCNAALYILLYF